MFKRWDNPKLPPQSEVTNLQKELERMRSKNDKLERKLRHANTSAGSSSATSSASSCVSNKSHVSNRMHSQPPAPVPPMAAPMLPAGAANVNRMPKPGQGLLYASPRAPPAGVPSWRQPSNMPGCAGF
eukprot:GFYU01025062.1.p1 GENE.GFYU01025062.1~~GFYU01025062.1.p1  ORF type:complete len:128 (-),score=12.05 GFYU01025062.1:184-567(-)